MTTCTLMQNFINNYDKFINDSNHLLQQPLYFNTVTWAQASWCAALFYSRIWSSLWVTNINTKPKSAAVCRLVKWCTLGKVPNRINLRLASALLMLGYWTPGEVQTPPEAAYRVGACHTIRQRIFVNVVNFWT